MLLDRYFSCSAILSSSAIDDTRSVAFLGCNCSSFDRYFHRCLVVRSSSGQAKTEWLSWSGATFATNDQMNDETTNGEKNIWTKIPAMSDFENGCDSHLRVDLRMSRGIAHVEEAIHFSTAHFSSVYPISSVPPTWLALAFVASSKTRTISVSNPPLLLDRHLIHLEWHVNVHRMYKYTSGQAKWQYRNCSYWVLLSVSFFCSRFQNSVHSRLYFGCFAGSFLYSACFLCSSCISTSAALWSILKSSIQINSTNILHVSWKCIIPMSSPLFVGDKIMLISRKTHGFYSLLHGSLSEIILSTYLSMFLIVSRLV